MVGRKGGIGMAVIMTHTSIYAADVAAACSSVARPGLLLHLLSYILIRLEMQAWPWTG